jgi:glycosyltransferase involved in cell wall biosynthesis
MESGLEVLIADTDRSGYLPLPSSVHRASLFPGRADVIDQTRLRKKTQRAAMIGALRLRHAAEHFHPHVIHSYRLDFYTDICLIAGLSPLVVSVWGYMNHWLTGEVTRKDWHWLRRLREGAHTLLVENPNMQAILTERRLGSMRVGYFPIGVDGHLFRPDNEHKATAWRFALDIPPDATVLLSPRGWSPTYGQQHIMRAFVDASGRIDTPLVLVLLGMGRMKRPERLAQEVHNLGVSLGFGHAIRWIPQVPHEDMPGVYALADIVVNYPKGDAFPSTLLEAAACGRPVITSALSAYRNTFIDRYCRLVEPENPAALADAIVEVAHSARALWAARAVEARRVVLAEYAEDLQKQRLMAVYNEIARQHTPH